MPVSPKRNVNSSSPERGSLEPIDRSGVLLQTANKSDPDEAILHGFVDQDTKEHACNDPIEPPNALARLMADHSDAEEDPMMMAQIGLVEDDWEFVDAEVEGTESDHFSSTSALVQHHDERDEFQETTDEEIKSSNDSAVVHDQHVRAMAYHVVPPYPIPPKYAILPKPEDTSHAAQVRRYKAFIKACLLETMETAKQPSTKRTKDSHVTTPPRFSFELFMSMAWCRRCQSGRSLSVMTPAQ